MDWAAVQLWQGGGGGGGGGGRGVERALCGIEAKKGEFENVFGGLMTPSGHYSGVTHVFCRFTKGATQHALPQVLQKLGRI